MGGGREVRCSAHIDSLVQMLAVVEWSQQQNTPSQAAPHNTGRPATAACAPKDTRGSTPAKTNVTRNTGSHPSIHTPQTMLRTTCRGQRASTCTTQPPYPPVSTSNYTMVAFSPRAFVRKPPQHLSTSATQQQPCRQPGLQVPVQGRLPRPL